MRVPRFHFPEAIVAGTTVPVRGERARYLTRVLRLRTDAPLTVFDGRGGEYRARIASGTRDGVMLQILDHVAGERESPLRVRLLQGISRSERMDLAIRKATELGVAEIWPVLTERSVVRLDDGQRQRRMARWHSVAASACEQCTRNRLPGLEMARTLEQSFRALPDDGPRLVLAAAGQARLGETPPPARGETVSLLIGPEGGLTADEHAAAVRAGCLPVRLGPRVLRTETACIAALAITQALWGDI